MPAEPPQARAPGARRPSAGLRETGVTGGWSEDTAQNIDISPRPPGSETQHSQGLFHKGLYGFGNLNTVEPELNWKQKSLSLYILKEKKFN